MWFELASAILSFVEIKSANKQLQNETNPSSVALFVWKWQSDEGEKVREILSKSLDFAFLLCQAFIIKGVEAKTVQYLDTTKQKSFFKSFLMQFSESKLHNQLGKYLVFFGPDWRGKPCKFNNTHPSKRTFPSAWDSCSHLLCCRSGQFRRISCVWRCMTPELSLHYS